MAPLLLSGRRLEVGGKSYAIRELASQEMKSTAGATWDATPAGNAIAAQCTSSAIRLMLFAFSNNDRYEHIHLQHMVKGSGSQPLVTTPTLTLLQLLLTYKGTIPSTQMFRLTATLRLLPRHALDGVDISTGIESADDAGNKIGSGLQVVAEQRSSRSQRSYR